MRLELTVEEQQALLSVLEEALPELREEIRKTDNFDLRELLKRREVFLRELYEKLQERRA